MTTIDYISDFILPAALAILPPRMDSPEARALLLAIGFQESGFVYRRQVLGPARGFWQFEEGGGVNGVLGHSATKPAINSALAVLHYQSWDCYDALADNDVLACIFARLLLWTHPAALPKEPAAAWDYYRETWRPGKPHRETWESNYAKAWEVV